VTEADVEASADQCAANPRATKGNGHELIPQGRWIVVAPPLYSQYQVVRKMTAGLTTWPDVLVRLIEASCPLEGRSR